MSDPAVLQTLSALPHFQMLEPDLLERLAALSRARTLRAGEILFHAGDACHGFFAIRSGGVKLYRSTPDGREQVVHNFRSGHTFAEAALLNMGRYPVSAVATESPTELVEVVGEPFLRLLREDPRLAPAVVGSLCMRLAGLVERVEELSLIHAGSRLARWLLRQPSKAVGRGFRIELILPKKDLAAHLSMTAETLSRLLRRWQEEGLVESERTSLTILEPARLTAVGDGDAEA
jgi:CRP/FNR family transcriptional regulator